MLRDGTKFVRSCDSCQKYKPQQQQIAGKMHATNVKEPWESVSVDLVGLQPRSSNDNHKKWDKYIPEIAFAFNSATNESTGFSPAYLNFGCELPPPGSKKRKPGIKNTEGDRIKILQYAIELARINKAMSFQKQQKYYNIRRWDWNPNVNDKVLKRSYVLSNKVENRNAKLSQKYDGPYTVHKVVSPVIFDLKKNGKITNHVHVKNLKPY
uniref:Integrase zinc-binding domain-containing protein n=1 Tax=Trichogramma kaykai TaxID=54128 RepID=A0ABD2W1S7_9HYME